MTVNKIAIRLGVEGGPELKRALDETGTAGQAAFAKVGAAAEQAGAATDRQTARYQKLATAAREAEAQARAQASVNTLLGVTTPPAGAARASAGVFEADLARQDQILAARQERMATLSQSRINDLLGVREGQAGGARASASVFEEQFRRDAERRDTVRSLIVSRESSAAADVVRASSFQAGLNDRLGVRPGSPPVGGQAGTGDRAADIAAYGRALDDTRAKFSPLFAAQRDYLGQLAEIRQAVKAGALTQVEGAAAIERTKTTFASQVKDIRTGTGPDRGLRAYEVQSLSYQVNDVATSLASGSSLTQVVAQQAGQIVQPFIGPGSASVRGALDQAGNAAAAFVTKIGPAGIALTALGVGLTAATAAAIAYNSQQRELERTTFGVGRASGATVDQLNQAADAAAGTGTLSSRSAREVVTVLNSTGRIDPALYADVAANMRDLARVMGVDFPEATEATKEALSGGIGGFDKLNDTLGLGGAALRNQVRELYESGKAFEAQRVIVDAYFKRIAEFTGQRPASRLAPGQAASNQIDLLGYLFGDTRSGEQKLADARARVRGLEYQRDAGEGISFSPRELLSAQAEVRKLEASVGGAAEKGKQARTELTSLTVQPLIDSLNPAQRQFEDLERKAKSIQEFLKGGAIDADGSARRAMEGLRDQARQLKEDMAAGGAGFADAVRAAEFGRRTSGFTPTAQTAAQIEEDARGKNIAALREAGLNTGTQEFFSRLQSIELERTTRLRTLDTDTLRAGNTAGGAFSRMSPEVQAQLQSWSTRFGRIPLNWLAAIAEIESNGNLDVGFTKVRDENGKVGTAYGLGQVTRDTGADLQRRFGIDRMNRATMGEALAGVLDMKLDAVGGDPARAVMAYRGSRDPSVNRAYLAEVQRRAGEIGDLSETGLAREQDARTRALRIEAETLRITTEAGGRDRDGTLARIEAMKAEEEARGRGIVVTREFAAQIGREAAQRQQLLSDGRFQDYMQDAAFQREQLGRTEGEARAAYVARSRGYDLDSPRGQAVMETERMNDALRTTKSVAGEAFTGLLTDLRRGTDLAASLSNITGRIADRFIGGAVDSVVSAAFAGEGKGGGGWISAAIASAKSAFTAADGRVPAYADGKTPSVSGAGIISGPGGPRDDSVLAWVSNREAIIRASSVERYGVDFIRSINEGTAPREVALMGRGRGMPRYADGTVPGRDAFTMPRAMAPAPTRSAATEIRVVNEFSSAEVTKRTRSDGNGGRREEIVIREAAVSGITSSQGRSALRNSQRLATG